VLQTLSNYALDLKPKITSPNFTVQPVWRDTLYRRLTAAGVTIPRAQYDSVGSYVDKLIETRVARVVYGDSTAKRRELSEDVQLKRAVELLKQGGTQKELFVVAERQPHAGK
jgi:hypothetical protein